MYQFCHLGDGEIITFSSHQVIINDLKDPKHKLGARIVEYITNLYIFEHFGSSSLPLVVITHNNDMIKL